MSQFKWPILVGGDSGGWGQWWVGTVVGGDSGGWGQWWVGTVVGGDSGAALYDFVQDTTDKC